MASAGSAQFITASLFALSGMAHKEARILDLLNKATKGQVSRQNTG
jgi:hypothetical protein